MFSFLKNKLGGLIEYYGLSDWWSGAFSNPEKEKIVAIFPNVISGNIISTSQHPSLYLSNMVGWFKAEEDRHIAYKLIEKAEALSKDAPILDAHFVYQAKIEIYYRFRDVDNFALEKSIEACRQQIGISNKAADAFREEYNDQALPFHVGYQQLSIILEKKLNFNEAESICKKALEQGWNGDWQNRISRYHKKKNKKIDKMINII